jgi:hypothetical protein
MQIREATTAPRAPWQNACVKRFIGSIQRDVLIGSSCQAPREHRVVNDDVAYSMRAARV